MLLASIWDTVPAAVNETLIPYFVALASTYSRICTWKSPVRSIEFPTTCGTFQFFAEFVTNQYYHPRQAVPIKYHNELLLLYIFLYLIEMGIVDCQVVFLISRKVGCG
jgi:hypothetical protein